MVLRLTNGCFKKCISKFKDADLSVAEMSCVDRCVTKFIAATNTSGMVMRQQQEQMMALMQGQQPQ